ncbi:anti-repressor SinI family protein [Virgibacillus byunsanensis]|uniref:Anti-repressor SinI family protein n=1 Tax=Virgibacillus byunsanensis TaxID=570945 RepID=A0ABW3LPC1_9BACI
MEKTVYHVGLDYEWIKLVKEAKTIGLSVEEVHLFLTGTEKSE